MRLASRNRYSRATIPGSIQKHKKPATHRRGRLDVAFL